MAFRLGSGEHGFDIMKVPCCEAPLWRSLPCASSCIPGGQAMASSRRHLPCTLGRGRGVSVDGVPDTSDFRKEQISSITHPEPVMKSEYLKYPGTMDVRMMVLMDIDRRLFSGHGGTEKQCVAAFI